VVIKTAAGEHGIAMKILQPAHLGPSRINAKRHDRQEQIHDPDFEIFRAAAGKFQLFLSDLHRRGRANACHGGVVHRLPVLLLFLKNAETT